ncbi:SRPBCC family protein [Amycolatopsis sp. H20-H5]|uniref:SRPBCC family protein n=1 Tax=Amycolatopsis sp. H20-H5 TaxID=3046309 RepID=UPI002DBD8B24|nr:SRPBCC family protein [Amycolatopsis sp. H20-H5]MEC3977467.1 SRPBCC family protein [Amycolatopsis sp. H20-H5]
MGIQHISAKGWSPAAPAVVYALLRDGASWPHWSSFSTFELLEEGEGGGEGMGALRRFRTGPTRSCEEIIALEPDRRFGYALRKGLPLRDYVGYVDLAPERHGTAIHWHSSFRARIPGTGWFYRRLLGSFIRRLVKALAAAAAVSQLKGAAA